MFNSIYTSEADHNKLIKLASVLTFGNKSKLVRILINLAWDNPKMLKLTDHQAKILEVMKAGEG